MEKIFYFLFLISFCVYSQENGNWDIESSEKKIVKLNAGQSDGILLNLPLGTTKILYSIKILKSVSNESVASLTDLITSNTIDPKTYILAKTVEQGVKMSDAKITYSISSQSDTKVNNCFSSNGIVTDEIKHYFDYTNQNCLDISGNNLKLYFRFTSQNNFFPLKVIFQVVYYIDEDLKRGWSKNIKNHLFENLVKNIKQSNQSLTIETIENNVNCILTNLTKDYTFHEFQLLAEYEKKNYFEKLKNICDK